MNKDVYGILGDLTAEILLEIIAECMDDYLYVIDLQNNKMEISQSALDRFMISETHVRNVKQEIMSVVYEEDRTMFAKHMQAVMDGKEKVHDIHYRWLDKNGLPVWVNCRGVVIDDEDGKPPIRLSAPGFPAGRPHLMSVTARWTATSRHTA